MRILHVITTIERGGAEKQLLHLAGVQVNSGHDVKVVFLKGKEDLLSDFAKAGVRVDDSISSIRFLAQVFRFRQLVRNFKPDLVHGHLPRTEILLRLSSIPYPFIISRHNTESFFPKRKGGISRWVSRWVTKKSKCVIAISQEVDRFLKASGEISSQTKTVVIPYGLPDVALQNSKKELSDNMSLLLCISRLAKQKNLMLLIQSFSKFLQLYPKSFLVIIGNGPEKQSLQREAELLNVNDRIGWLQSVEDVDFFIDHSDCFVLTSVYEGFGLVLLESMLRKLPIISSDIPTSREVLGEGYIGLFQSNSVEALLGKLLEFNDLRKRVLSVNQQAERLQMFDIEKTNLRILEIYRNIVISKGEM